MHAGLRGCGARDRRGRAIARDNDRPYGAGDASQPGRGLGRLPARQPRQRGRPPRGRRLRRGRAGARVRHPGLHLRRGRHPRPRRRLPGRAFGSRTDDFEVLYASKAAPFTAAYRVLCEAGLSVDVASGGELHMALRAGFAPEPDPHARQQQDRGRAAARGRGRGRARDLRLAAPRSSASTRSAPRPGAASEVLIRITPGSRPTPTPTSRPASWTRSSASGSPTAWPSRRSRRSAALTTSSWSGCTLTSARRSSSSSPTCARSRRSASSPTPSGAGC